MDEGGGGNPRGLYSGIGVCWWLEVKQWHFLIGVSGTASSNDGGEVVGMQCPGDYSY